MNTETYYKIDELINPNDITIIKMILNRIDEVLELNQIDYFDGLEYIKDKLNLNHEKIFTIKKESE